MQVQFVRSYQVKKTKPPNKLCQAPASAVGCMAKHHEGTFVWPYLPYLMA